MKLKILENFNDRVPEATTVPAGGFCQMLTKFYGVEF